MLPPKPIRVLVADSHEMSRYGLRIFLETFDDLELVGEAQEEEIEILRMCAQRQPDIVLISLNRKSKNGLYTIRTLREQFPRIRVIALSTSRLLEDLVRAIEAGASGYLLKDEVELSGIAAVIREVAR